MWLEQRSERREERDESRGMDGSGRQSTGALQEGLRVIDTFVNEVGSFYRVFNI